MAQCQIALSFKLPAAASLDKVVVGSTLSAALADNTQVFGDLVTNGGNLDLGVGAKLGSLFVNGTATLHDSDRVFGNLVARHVVKPSSATVSGTTTENDTTPATITNLSSECALKHAGRGAQSP